MSLLTLSVFSFEKKNIALWLSTSDYHIVLIYNFINGNLLSKKSFPVKLRNIFGFNFSMAVQLNYGSGNSFHTMTIILTVYHSHDNFSKERKLHQVTCDRAHLFNCSVADNKIIFLLRCKLLTGFDSYKWHRMSLTPDLMSVKYQDILSFKESIHEIQWSWLDMDHAYSLKSSDQ